MRKRYTDTAPKGRRYLRSGFSIKKFGGFVSGIGPSNLPDTAAQGMQNLTREDGSLKVRNGYRNVMAPVTSVTTIKGFWWCQTYSGGVIAECIVCFLYDGADLKPYEFNYDAATDSWGLHEIKNGASSLSLHNTYWRRVCFQDKVYFFNKDDSPQVYSYTIGSYTSATPITPPDAPSSPPTLTYYLNDGSNSYAGYLGAQSGYVAGDVATDGVVATTVNMVGYGQNIRVKLAADGKFTITMNLKHSGGNVDLSDDDAYALTVSIDDPGHSVVQLANLKFSLYNGTTTQELVSSIVSKEVDLNRNGNDKQAVIYLKHPNKTVGTRSTWATATQLIVEGDVTGYSADNFIFFLPLKAGGIVDWGPNNAQMQFAYSAYDSTNQLESGLSLSRNVDMALMRGQLLDGQGFPMGSVPRVTITAGPADKFRLYARVKIGSDDWSAWRRIVEQNDATTTYTYAYTYSEFTQLSEYAPAPFDYEDVVAAYQSNNHIVWLYAGKDKNVRRSRDGVAIAQASIDDAYKTSISQDDVLRGANYTLIGDFQDEPWGGVSLPGGDVILGKNNVYISYDLGDGLPSGFSHPEPCAGAPGCMGPHAFARWHDVNGLPIVVYLDSTGDQLYAVRVPRGYSPNQPIAQSTMEFGQLVRSGLNDALFGNSVQRSEEAATVYVDPRDDSLHLRYNKRELVMRRPDLADGSRHWEPVVFGTGQYGSQWAKVIAFTSSSVKHGIFGMRLTGAVDEFYQAGLKDPSGERLLVDIDGRSYTPTSINAVTDIVAYSSPTGWSSGTPAKNSLTGNGLTAGVQYYLCRQSYLTYSFHLTQADAQTGANKVNLTGGAWVAGTVTPNGRDDGAAIDSDIYWHGKSVLGDRRRPRRAHVQKSVLTDSFDVTAYDEFGNSVVCTVGSGRTSAAFPVGLAGFELSYRIDFAETDSPVDGFWTEEANLSQLR